MSSIVLFIFEGKKTEPNISHSLCKYFLNDTEKVILRVSYGFNLYKLYKEISQDEDLDTLELIKEQLQTRLTSLKPEEEEILNIEDSGAISDIYLFFDYDCHCGNADDTAVQEMLGIFSEPHDKGLLCISYPMVEAIRQQKSPSLCNEFYAKNKLPEYKSWVNRSNEFAPRYHNWGLYDLQIWGEIIVQHLSRANHLVNEELALPEEPIEQSMIFRQQIEKYDAENLIAVISAFPLMLFDFYGSKLFGRISKQPHCKT